jgi:GTPase involved in cell partitioning and DNA repair
MVNTVHAVIWSDSRTIHCGAGHGGPAEAGFLRSLELRLSGRGGARIGPGGRIYSECRMSVRAMLASFELQTS